MSGAPEGKRALEEEKKNQLDALQTSAGDDGAEAKTAVGASRQNAFPFPPPSPPHKNKSKWVHRFTSGPLRKLSQGARWALVGRKETFQTLSHRLEAIGRAAQAWINMAGMSDVTSATGKPLSLNDHLCP